MMSTGFKSSPEATLLLSILDVARDLAAGTETVSETKRALHRLGNPLPTPSEAEDLLRRAEQRIQEILNITPAQYARLDADYGLTLTGRPGHDELRIVARPANSGRGRARNG